MIYEVHLSGGLVMKIGASGVHTDHGVLVFTNADDIVAAIGAGQWLYVQQTPAIGGGDQ